MADRIRIAAVLVLALAVVVDALASAAADAVAVERLLRRVPENAQLVAIVPNLSRAAEGLSAFAKATDIETESPITGRDLVDGLGAPAELLDLNGPLVFAMSALNAEPVVVARLASATSQPATRPARTIAGVSVLEFEDGLLAKVDEGIAVIARDEEALRPALESRGELGQTLARDVVGHFPDRQVMLYVDIAAWKERVDVVLNMVAQTSMMGLAAAGPEAAEAIHMQRWFFDQFRWMLGEARMYAAGATFSADGIAYEDHITVKPDGTMAKYLSAVRATDRDLLRGLWAERAAAVFALEWSVPPEIRTVEEAMYEAILMTDERRERIGPERLRVGLERVKTAHRRISGYSSAMEWRPKSRSMTMTGVYLTDNPSAYVADFRAIFRDAPELFECWASLPGGCKIEHAAASIGETTVDQFNFTVSAGGSPVEAAIGAVYGENPTLCLAPSRHGASFYLGPAEQSRDALERMLASDPNTALAADPRVKTALARLAPRPQLVVLLDMMRLIELSMEMSRAMGVPSVRFPPSSDASEYISYGLYLQADGVRQQVYVPVAGVRDVIRNFKQLKNGSIESGD